MLQITCKVIGFCTIAAERGVHLKPVSTTKLGQQKPAPVPLRPQASHPVQLVSVQHPNSQQGIPRRSVQKTKHTGTQTPAAKQLDVHLKSQLSKCVEQQDRPNPTLQQGAVKGPLQQGAQRANSQQPGCTLSSSGSAVTTRSPTVQHVVSPEYDLHFPVSSHKLCIVQVISSFIIVVFHTCYRR